MHRACPGLVAEEACCHDVQEPAGTCGHHLYMEDGLELALAAHQAPSPLHPCHETCLCLQPAGLSRLAAVQGPSHTAEVPSQFQFHLEAPRAAVWQPRASAHDSITLTCLRTVVLRT
ncbi:MAG: hypothetical protein L6R28_22105 [Planctomycetes bacterium]|nr:hypothetical protein [Planctomycetota bacterium]